MSFVPYTKEALTRIKNGATATELGWSELFYARICREHGLERIIYRPQTHIAPEIAAPFVPPPKKTKPAKGDKSLPPATGPVIFYASTRTLSRGEHRAQLSPRVCDVFVLICKGTREQPANGRRIAERLSIKHVESGIGSHVMVIRNRLRLLDLSVISQSGRVNSGYWIADGSTATPIKVRVLR